MGNDIPGFPILRGQVSPYLLKRLQEYADGVTPHPIMSPIASSLSEIEQAAIADFYAVQPAPFSEHREYRAVEDAPEDVESRRGWQIARHGIPEQGIRACEACHDRGGTGFVRFFPYLAGQPAHYMEAQFAFWKSGQRSGDPMNVMTDIARRINDSDMRAVSRYYEMLAQPRKQDESHRE